MRIHEPFDTNNRHIIGNSRQQFEVPDKFIIRDIDIEIHDDIINGFAFQLLYPIFICSVFYFTAYKDYFLFIVSNSFL